MQPTAIITVHLAIPHSHPVNHMSHCKFYTLKPLCLSVTCVTRWYFATS